jgi:putative mRNA 3-end processing factor
MLSFADGVHVRGTALYLDARRPRKRGIVTHAHSDHVGRHLCWVSTPATALLCARRWGQRQVESRGYGEAWMEKEARVTLLPAGHVLGSAMVLVEHEGMRILYTGDFRTKPSLTAEPCAAVAADVLVMECTFGHPRFRFPAREEVEGQIVEFARGCLRKSETPVLLVYSLGKAQETAKMLGERGFRVALHSSAWQMLEAYRQLGVEFRNCERLVREPAPGTVVLLPPYLARSRAVARFPRPRTAFLSGWAIDPRARARVGADRAFALSDHADFDELCSFAQSVGPRQVYTLHGPDGFSDHLRGLGLRAEPARIGAQLQLI